MSLTLYINIYKHIAINNSDLKTLSGERLSGVFFR